MLQNYLVTFGGLSLAGLLIMILGLRVNGEWKRGIETLGATILHVGVFGILYHKVSLVLFVALVALMLSIFVLIDPLKLSTYVQPRAYRIVGLFLLFTSIAFSTMYFTNFPVWLWVVPLVIYLLPHAVPPWKSRAVWFHFCAWFIVLAYMTLSWYSVYSRFYPDKKFDFLTDWFAGSERASLNTGLERETIVIPVDKDDGSREERPVVVQKPDLPPVQPSLPAPTVPPALPERDATLKSKPAPRAFEGSSAIEDDGPFLQSLKKADEKYLRLKQSYEALEMKYEELQEENERLREDGNAAPERF